MINHPKRSRKSIQAPATAAERRASLPVYNVKHDQSADVAPIGDAASYDEAWSLFAAHAQRPVWLKQDWYPRKSDQKGLAYWPTYDYREMHAADLATLVKRGDETAQWHIDRRQKTRDIVRGVLAHLGHSYSGTSGWHVIAMVAPDHYLGFLDISRGAAILTDCRLALDLVDASTVPQQRDGVLASGAAIWTSPDAGEGRNASAPIGWRQLIIDIRTFEGPVAPVEACVTRRSACFRTCYDRMGFPDAVFESQFTSHYVHEWLGDGHQPIEEHPAYPGARERVRHEQSRIIAELGALLPDSTITDAFDLSAPAPQREAAFRAHGPVRHAMKDYIAWLAASATDGAGDVYTVLEERLRRATIERLVPVVQALEASTPGQWSLLREPALKAAAECIITHLTAPWQHTPDKQYRFGTDGIIGRLRDAYYAVEPKQQSA